MCVNIHGDIFCLLFCVILLSLFLDWFKLLIIGSYVYMNYIHTISTELYQLILVVLYQNLVIQFRKCSLSSKEASQNPILGDDLITVMEKEIIQRYWYIFQYSLKQLVCSWKSCIYIPIFLLCILHSWVIWVLKEGVHNVRRGLEKHIPSSKKHAPFGYGIACIYIGNRLTIYSQLV